MALVKIVPEKNGYKGRAISVGKDGLFILSKELNSEVKNIPGLGVDFYQDDKDKKNWFMSFSVSGIIPVRLKSDGYTYHFHSVEMRKLILKSVNVKDEVLRNRIKIIVGKMIIKDSTEVYPLVTSSILTQVLPLVEKV